MQSNAIPTLAQVAAVALALSVDIAAAAENDVSELSLEQLLDVSVYSASKFNRKASAAPASMSVITAEETQ